MARFAPYIEVVQIESVLQELSNCTDWNPCYRSTLKQKPQPFIQ